MKKTHRARRNTREQVFLTAAELFTKKGYDAVSIREICEKVGVGKPALYYYFRDKESLLVALIDEAYRVGFDYLSRHTMPHWEWKRKFHGLLKAASLYSREYPVLIRFFFSLPHMVVPPNVGRKVEALKQQELNFFTDLLKEGKRVKCISKEVDLDILLSLLLGSIQLMVTKPRGSEIPYPWHDHDVEELFMFFSNNILQSA